MQQYRNSGGYADFGQNSINGFTRDERIPNHGYGSNFGDEARPYGEDHGEDTGYKRQPLNNPNTERYYGNLGNEYDQFAMSDIPPAGGSYSKSNHDYRGYDYFTRSPGTGKNHIYGNLYGRHHGKGPRGYKRSDERIGEEIHDLLTEDPCVDASEINVKVQDGEVTLSGTVNDRSEKRRTEDIIESVLGVTNVENRVRISSRVLS